MSGQCRALVSAPRGRSGRCPHQGSCAESPNRNLCRCSARAQIAELSVYAHGMGTVIRCPNCDTALIRIAHINRNFWLDMRGVVSLQIAEEE